MVHSTASCPGSIAWWALWPRRRVKGKGPSESLAQWPRIRLHAHQTWDPSFDPLMNHLLLPHSMYCIIVNSTTLKNKLAKSCFVYNHLFLEKSYFLPSTLKEKKKSRSKLYQEHDIDSWCSAWIKYIYLYNKWFLDTLFLKGCCLYYG